MLELYNDLLKSFDKAIEKKEANKFGKDDIAAIYSAASKLFDGTMDLEKNQLEQVCKKWVLLSDGKLTKSSALKKLQGTSRAEAIQSVLLSTV